MNGKILGYAISAIGILALAMASFPSLQAMVGVKSISGTMLTIAGVIITVIGIMIILKIGHNTKQEVKDLPVYEGENVVAYRRHHKK
jgi:hypothetical protein